MSRPVAPGLAREIAASPALLKELLDSAQEVALISDLQGTVLYAGGAARELFGWPAEGLLGANWCDLFHPEDGEALRSRADRLGVGESAERLVRLRVLGGGFRWVRITVRRTARALPDAVLVNLRDASDSKEGEAVLTEAIDALKRGEAYLSMLMGSTQEALAVLDPKLRTLYLNPAGRNLLGLLPDEPADSSLVERVHPDDLPGVRLAMEPLKRGEAVTRRLRMFTRSAQWLLLDCRAQSYRDPDGRDVVVVTARDVRELPPLRPEVGDRMETIGRLAGGVAHDFNNLLTVIEGNAELALADLPGDSELAQRLSEIMEAAGRAAELTGQLLSFDRRQAGKPRLLDLNVLVERDLRLIGRLLGADIEVVPKLATGLPLVFADPGHLERILVNLCARARHVLPRGGSLVIRTREATVTEAEARLHPERRKGRFVVLEISDNGRPLPPEVARHIFEPYFNVQEQGDGLGMAAVFGLVHAFGGFVDVASAQGKGSVFNVHFPAAAPTSVEAELPTGLVEAPEAAEIHGRILLVEDRSSVKHVAATQLRREGYEVLEASAGEEAWEIWKRERAEGRRLSLVLTDVVMPGVGGLSLAEKIRENDPEQKILLVSGYNEEAFTGRGEDSVNRYPLLPKPFTRTALLEAVHKLVP
jgi:PAS domain S-box-containing protein